MNIITTTKKNITANENGVILPDYKGYPSASFLAKLPKCAVVDHIKVDGKFLDDVNTKKISYHVALFEGEFKVVATVWFDDTDLDLYEKLASYEVQDFEVYYHLEVEVE